MSKKMNRSRSSAGVLICSSLLICAAATLWSGCSKPRKAPVSTRSTSVEIGELPALGAPMGPLDDGRIRVAPPEDWSIPPRSSQWIVRFKESDNLKYPSILITAEDYENVFNVTRANVGEFARQISDALTEDNTTARLSENIEPVEIGDLMYIAYQRRAKVTSAGKSVVLDRLFLETVAAGRKYTIELRTRTGTIDKYRPYVHAVAGGIEFLAANPEPPDADKPPEPAKEESEDASPEEPEEPMP